MEEQAPYGNQRRLNKRPSGQQLEQTIRRIREFADATRQQLILDDNRKAIAVDEKNQAMLQGFLDKTLGLTDTFFE
jgi:hypothetical protein